MAILKNKKNDIRSEIRSKVKKIDFKEVLDNEVIENNIQELLGGTTALPIEVYKYIGNTLEKNNEELKKQIKSKIDELIPDSTVRAIEDFVNIKMLNQKTEAEIKNLKSKINLLNLDHASGDELIEKFKLEIELSEKEVELQKNKERFIEVYKESFKSTLIPAELFEVFSEVTYIRNEMREDYAKEIELIKAKTQVVREISKRSNILDDVSAMIEDRLNRFINIETIIETSKEQIPLVQALIK